MQNNLLKYNRLYIVIAFAMTMFFSCSNNLKEMQNKGVSKDEPIGVAENIHLKYTDSGKVKAILKSPIMYDYSNRKFAYNEFPEGVVLELVEGDKKNIIISDYGVVYKKTSIIDLRGNVRIKMENNDSLFAEQLYFDERKEWLFTNKPVRFRTGQDVIHGNGFDSDKTFKNAEVLEITGVITVDSE